MQGPLKSSGTANRRYPLSRDFIGSIQKSPVGPIFIVGSRKAVKPPEAQDHRNTTFPGQENKCRRMPRWAAPSRLRVHGENQNAFHAKSQSSLRKEDNRLSFSGVPFSRGERFLDELMHLGINVRFHIFLGRRGQTRRVL